MLYFYQKLTTFGGKYGIQKNGSKYRFCPNEIRPSEMVGKFHRVNFTPPYQAQVKQKKKRS
jgi:hypothetical protein